METLQQQLAQLTPEQVRQLLSASGHAQFLQTQQQQHSVSTGAQSESTLLQAEQARQRGNECFHNKEFVLAVEAYSAIFNLLRRSNLWTRTHVRFSFKIIKVQLQTVQERSTSLHRLRFALHPCEDIDILGEQPLTVLAAARIELEEFNDAVQDLIAALSFEPHNKECVAKLLKIASLHSVHNSPSKVDRSTCIKAALAVTSRDGWKSIAVKGNPAPPALNGHMLFHGAGGKIYLFGGRSVRDQKTQVYALDSRDYSWDVVSMGGSSPSPRAWHSISCIDSATSTMCIYGGVSSQGEDPHIHFLSFETGNPLVWSQPQRIEGDTPSPRSGHSATSIQRSNAASCETFIFGGRTKSGVSESMFILRSSKTEYGSGDQSFTCTWEEVAQQAGPWPAPRDGHTMCALPPTGDDDTTNTKLVLFGGNGQQNEEKMNDTWIFDTESRQWQELDCTGEIPPPRSYHTAHMVGSCMFVVGGRMRDAEDSEVYMLDTAILVFLNYSTVSREWFCVPIPEKARLAARAWHSSILTDELKIFLLGGGTFTGPQKDAALLDLSKFAALVTK